MVSYTFLIKFISFRFVYDPNFMIEIFSKPFHTYVKIFFKYGVRVCLIFIFFILKETQFYYIKGIFTNLVFNH